MKEQESLVKTNYGKDFSNHLLEQYKLYVETAERVSDRRQSANNFYITLNSAVATLSGYLSATLKDFWTLFIAFIGIIISLLWMQNINSYKQLNTGKFIVIHEMEKHLPFPLFKMEWDHLERGEGKKYKKLTVVEKNVPKIFILVYIVIIIISILYLFKIFSWVKSFL